MGRIAWLCAGLVLAFSLSVAGFPAAAETVSPKPLPLQPLPLPAPAKPAPPPAVVSPPTQQKTAPGTTPQTRAPQGRIPGVVKLGPGRPIPKEDIVSGDPANPGQKMKPPIPFKPFTLEQVFDMRTGKLLFADKLDPVTGEPLFGTAPSGSPTRFQQIGSSRKSFPIGAAKGPVTMESVITLPRRNGGTKTGTAGQYLKQLNDLEGKLNRIGETLRDPATGKINTKPVRKTLAYINNHLRRMNAQRNNTLQKMTPESARINPAWPIRNEDIRRRYEQAARNTPEVLARYKQVLRAGAELQAKTIVQKTGTASSGTPTVTPARIVPKAVGPNTPAPAQIDTNVSARAYKAEDAASAATSKLTSLLPSAKSYTETEQKRLQDGTKFTPTRAFFYEVPWSEEFGDRNTFAIKLGASLSIGSAGNDYKKEKESDPDLKNKVVFTGSGGLSAVVIGKEASVLGLMGQCTIPTPAADDNMTTVVIADVFLDQYLLFKDSRDVKYTVDDKIMYPVDASVSTTFMIGPVPMGATVGFRGSVGAGYAFGLTPIQLEGKAIAFANAQAYGEAYIDMLLAEAGIGVELTLIDLELTTHAFAGIDFGNKIEDLGLAVDAGIQANIKALNGRVYAFVDCAIDRYELQIFKWDGLDWTWDIFGPFRYTFPFYANRRIEVVVNRIRRDGNSPYPADRSIVGFSNKTLALPGKSYTNGKKKEYTKEGNPAAVDMTGWAVADSGFNNSRTEPIPVTISFADIDRWEEKVNLCDPATVGFDTQFLPMGCSTNERPYLENSVIAVEGGAEYALELLLDINQNRITAPEGSQAPITVGTITPFKVLKGPWIVEGTILVSEI